MTRHMLVMSNPPVTCALRDALMQLARWAARTDGGGPVAARRAAPTQPPSEGRAERGSERSTAGPPAYLTRHNLCLTGRCCEMLWIFT
jgi:hypothetical protein